MPRSQSRRSPPRRSVGNRLGEVLTIVVLTGALGYAGYVIGVRTTSAERAQMVERVADRVRVPVPAAFGKPRLMRTVYLNREGARLHGGPDDSQANHSSIVAHAGVPYADVPAFAGTPARWRAITRCIAGLFKPFDVRVVEQRPIGEDYIMAVLGGTIDILGETGKKQFHHALGLSPYNGEPIEDAVVLIFTRTAREQTRKVCDTAGMEIAHAYGLDHARNCKDLMTYMPACGAKRFVDKAVSCGEKADRVCGDGQATQNSYARLLALLGPRP